MEGKIIMSDECYGFMCICSCERDRGGGVRRDSGGDEDGSRSGEDGRDSLVNDLVK